MKTRRAILAVLAVVIGGGFIAGWVTYRRVRADYDAYRSLIQPGVKIGGVPVGGLTPDEAQAQVTEQVAKPHFRDFVLHYGDEILTLSPGSDLNLNIPVGEMVAEAVAASHNYDYWEGFRSWIQKKAITADVDVPVEMTFDPVGAGRFLEAVADRVDISQVEPMVDVRALTFIPGSPGRHLDVETSAKMINERVSSPQQREVVLPFGLTEPDQSRPRIESMLSTLGPVMERAPTPPSFYTATIPISTTTRCTQRGGLANSPVVTYTGPLTWTFPHFSGYTGPLTSTYGFFFDLGEPGFTFDVTRAADEVEAWLQAGRREPIQFEPDLVPPPALTSTLLIPPLEERLAQFPGVTSLLVKNLNTDEVIYESGVDYVMAGMSIVKIGIMIEVYRYYGGILEAQTQQELYDMLGSESCNPCANRLLAAIGGGDAGAGAQMVTSTMRRLGLANFRLCGPFRVVDSWDGEDVWAAEADASVWFVQAKTPRFDPCVKATPREMANLLEMIYHCTKDRGLLRDAYPSIFEPRACEEMIEIMAANDLRNMLGAGIPAEVKLAHKHGFAGYDVPWGDTRAEVGIVFSPGATWLISFYLWDDTPWLNYGIVQPLYRDVSNLLYNYFNPGEVYWPLPPWAPEPEEITGEGET